MNFRRAPILACCTIWASTMCLAGLVDAATLRGRVVDGATGAPLASRVYIRTEQGKWFFPRSSSPEGSAIEYNRESSAVSREMHTALSAHPFEVELPAGRYSIRVVRGKEFRPAERDFEIGDADVDLEIELNRWIDMAARGWYSGDTHSHRSLDETRAVVLAEDLNIAFPLSHWVTDSRDSPRAANRVEGPEPAPEPIQVDPTHIVYPLNTEYELFTVEGRNHTLGAVVIIGHKRPFDLAAPPVGPIAEEAHRQGALLDLEKHSWAWSVAIVPVMGIDLFELANNHVWETEFGYPQWTLPMAGRYMNLEMNDRGFTEWGWIDFGFQTYYALLNCGLKIAPTAGTAAGVHPVPLGFGRVYVDCLGNEEEKRGGGEEGTPGFTYENWIAGLKAGRSFVTTGPMLSVEVEGRVPGDTLPLKPEGAEALVKGTIESLEPIDRVEVIVNGRIEATARFEVAEGSSPDRGFEHKFEAGVRIEGGGWIAVRTFERRDDRRIRFAHSAPVYIDVPGNPVRPRPDELAYLVGRCEEEIERNEGVLAPEALDEYKQALEFYRGLAP